MKRVGIALAAALLLTAIAAPRDRFQDRFWGRFQGRWSAITTAAPYSWAYFEFARDAGAGAPVLGLDSAQNLCSAWSALDPSPTQSGCLDGNTSAGTNTASTGGPWVAFGSGASDSSDIVLPNGPGGAPVLSRRTTTASGWALTSAITNNTGGLTACWWGVLDNVTSTTRLLSHETGATAATVAWELSLASGNLTATASTGSVTNSAVKGTLIIGAPHVLCETWSAAAGVEACVDGSCTAGAALASMTALSAKPTVNGQNGAAVTSFPMRTFGAFYSSTRLTDAQIATLAHAVLADQPKGVVQGAANAALTFTRATVKSCPADTTGAALSILPSGRPCVTMGGLHVEAASTNLILQSQTVATGAAATAPWNLASAVTGSLPTVNADQAVAPDGTLTADAYNFSACSGATGASAMYQDFTATSGAVHTCSGYVKGNGASGQIALYNYNSLGAAGNATLCNVVSTGWTRCSHTWTQLANTSGRFGFGCQNDTTVTGRTALSALNTYVWGFQCEVQPVATSYIPTTGASATRNAEYAYFTPTLTGGTWPGSIAASTVNMGFESGLGVPVMVDNGGAAGVNFFGIQGSASNAMSCQLQTGSGNKSTNLTGTTGAGTDRFSCFADGATLQGYFNGSGPYSAAATGAAITPLSRITIGSWGTGLTRHCNCSVSNVIYDTSTTRAR